MKIFTKPEDICIPDGIRSCVTLGKFDGIHLGHQKLFETCRNVCGDDMIIAFTFDFFIRSVLAKKPVKNLFSSEEKRQLIEKEGAKILIEYPFTDEIRMMDPHDFINKILVEDLHARTIVIGDNFHFGYNRSGDASLLSAASSECGFKFIQVDMVKDKYGEDIGSTRIRQALLNGDMGLVNEMLGFPYFIEGEIVHGRHLGRTIGSPTINQIPDSQKLLPPNGVYFSRVLIGDMIYDAVTNIGQKPTVSDEHLTGAETFIFNFSGDVYGQTVRTYLYEYFRPERVFDDVKMLASQIKRDRKSAEIFWRKYSVKSADVLPKT